MVGYCEKILTEKFTDKQSKKCYMKAVKWLALNIVSKPELNGQVVYNITKSFADNKYTYTVEVYSKLDGQQVQERHCAICEETHNSFFVNHQQDCNNCNFKAYLNRKRDMIKVKNGWVKEQLEKGGIN